jgi:hypothetical protein
VEIPARILLSFIAVIFVFIVAGSLKTLLQLALNQRLRRRHYEVWCNMETLDYFPLLGLPVLGFVVSGEFRKVRDKQVQLLGSAVLFLWHAVIWALGIDLGVVGMAEIRCLTTRCTGRATTVCGSLRSAPSCWRPVVQIVSRHEPFFSSVAR